MRVTIEHSKGGILINTLSKTLTIRFTEDERSAVERYAAEKGISLSRLARESILEKIEDEYDLKIYMEWLQSDRKTVSFEKIVKECGFSDDTL